jgi:hypothetical protein
LNRTVESQAFVLARQVDGPILRMVCSYVYQTNLYWMQ